MRRVPPSVWIHEELDRLLAEGAGPGENLISELVQTVTRLVVQQLAEAEQTDYLGDRGFMSVETPTLASEAGAPGMWSVRFVLLRGRSRSGCPRFVKLPSRSAPR